MWRSFAAMCMAALLASGGAAAGGACFLLVRGGGVWNERQTGGVLGRCLGVSWLGRGDLTEMRNPLLKGGEGEIY